MDPLRFVVEASDAESMAESSGLSVLQLLPTLVKSAQSLARPTISNYHVGAVGLGSDGRIFIGVNLEFPGLPLHHSVHAEQFLLTNVTVHGCPSLLYVAVSAAPCGHCRQFFQELRNASNLQIMITSEENPIFKPLSSILPNPFGPFDLLDDETPLLLDKHENELSLESEISKEIHSEQETDSKCDNLCNGVWELSIKNESDLKIASTRAANNSHAPYSGCPSGVALMDCDGKIFTGSYIESAAHNPSLGPVQAALVAYVAGGGSGYERIVAGVLVEKKGTLVNQVETARLLLKAVSPKCDLGVFHCLSSFR